MSHLRPRLCVADIYPNPMKTRYLLPLLSFVALPLVPAHADVTGFGTGTGFTLTKGQANTAGPSIANGVLTLTSGVNNQGNSTFFNTKQNINAFNVSFTYTDVGGTGNASSTADGVTFTLQNDGRGASAVGYIGNTLGYAGGTNPLLGSMTSQNAIGTSAAVGFNIYNNSTTGFGTNGALTLNNNSLAVLYSGHPINVNLSYNGTTLTETLTDSTIPANTSTFTYATNLASVLGAGTAYVGFTGADGATSSTQTISNFTFAAVPEPSTWTAGVLGLGLCAVAMRRQYRRSATSIVSK